jgi:glycosidase
VSGFDPTRISHFHGGDLVGLTSKLDYIQHLGATAIWITPPFTNKPMQEGTAGYHGYWILDFFKNRPAPRHRRGIPGVRGPGAPPAGCASTSTSWSITPQT